MSGDTIYPGPQPVGRARYECCDSVEVDVWHRDGRECWLCGRLVPPNGYDPEEAINPAQIVGINLFTGSMSFIDYDPSPMDDPV